MAVFQPRSQRFRIMYCKILHATPECVETFLQCIHTKHNMLFRAVRPGQMYPRLFNAGTILPLMKEYGTVVSSGRPRSSKNLPHRVVRASMMLAMLALDAFLLGLRFAWIDP